MSNRLVTDVEMAHVIALREDKYRRVVDCGHLAQPDFWLVPNWRELADTPGMGAAGTTGYGTTEDGKKRCYDCCTAFEVERMKTADVMTVYLSTDNKRVTTWPGGTLGTVTEHYVSKAARKTYVKATDVHGAHWSGQGRAESGTYITLRRRKG
ncbi:hypothetical protein E1091_03415 [Micromonospora fluostatini]|uniref:Uncharacterized protein n=1 Tax=Micromonospora fluostatini TaxID=1629071 RepID=A0ABY2DKH0_9ACTN|nr:hypothetical protein E1091_03415 [Micromonospora fluostatini]